MKKKKIIIFNHASVIGGAGLSLLDIVRSIDRDKFEVIIYTVSDKPVIADILEKEEFDVIRAGKSPVPFSHFSGGEYPALSVASFFNCLRILGDFKRIKQVLLQVNPDIVMVNSMTLFWIGMLLDRTRQKAICFDRETFVKGAFGIRTAIMKHVMDTSFDKVVFISEYDRKEMRSKHTSASVIYDRIDYDKYQTDVDPQLLRKELALPEDKYLILFVGGLSFLKGAHIAFTAMNELQDLNIALVVLQGNIPEKPIPSFFRPKKKEQSVYEAYTMVKKPENIIFRGTVNSIERYLHACEAMIFTSVFPHQARPIYEAGAAGRIIIISNFKNTEEHLRDSVNGLTFIAGDAKDLAAKIKLAYKKHGSNWESNILYENRKRAKDEHNISSLTVDMERLLEFGDSNIK